MSPQQHAFRMRRTRRDLWNGKIGSLLAAIQTWGAINMHRVADGQFFFIGWFMSPMHATHWWMKKFSYAGQWHSAREIPRVTWTVWVVRMWMQIVTSTNWIIYRLKTENWCIERHNHKWNTGNWFQLLWHIRCGVAEIQFCSSAWACVNGSTIDTINTAGRRRCNL